MKKLIFLPIFLLAVVFGGKFYVESQYEKELDKALENVAMFIDISYDKVKIKLDGSLSIHGISVKPLEELDELKIGSIEFNSNNKSYLYKGLEAFSDFENNPPEYIRVSVNSVVVEADGYFYDKMSENKQLCDADTDSVYMTDLGYDQLEIDGGFELSFVTNQQASVAVNLDILGMEKLTVDASLDLKDFAPASVLFGMTPKMVSIGLNYSRDEQYSNKVIAYCAAKKNLTEEEYLDVITGSPEFLKSVGIQPGEGIKQALQKIASGTGELRISANPSAQLEDMGQLLFYKPEDYIKLLNLEVFVNGAIVQDLSFTQVAVAEKEEMPGLAEALAAASQMESGDDFFGFSMDSNSFESPELNTRASSKGHKGPVVRIDVALKEEQGVSLKGLNICRPDVIPGFSNRDEYDGYSCSMDSCDFTFSPSIPIDFEVFTEGDAGNCQKKTFRTAGNIKILNNYAKFKISDDIYRNSGLSFGGTGNDITKTDSSQFYGRNISFSKNSAKIELTYQPDSNPKQDEFIIGDHLFVVHFSDKYKHRNARLKYETNIENTNKNLAVVQSARNSDVSQQRVERGFSKIKYGNAKKYIGYLVKVQRKSAAELEGQLVSVKNGRLKIQQRRYGGVVDFPVKFTEIKSIEVYL